MFAIVVLAFLQKTICVRYYQHFVTMAVGGPTSNIVFPLSVYELNAKAY